MNLDIVIPAHNEEGRIGPTLRAYRTYFSDPGIRFMVALDDCRDATAAIVGRHASEDSRVTLHPYPKLGKGGVIQATFRRSSADLVAFVDADGSTPPRELERLAEEVGSSAGAIASRRLPSSIVRGRRPAGRESASVVFAWLVQRLFGLPYRDTQCGAKVIRRDVLEHLLPFLTTHDLLFDLDLLLTARRLGYSLAEVPTVWSARTGSRVSLTRDATRTVSSLLRLWIDHRPTGSDSMTDTIGPRPWSEGVA